MNKPQLAQTTTTLDVARLRQQIPLLRKSKENQGDDQPQLRYLDYASTALMPVCVLEKMWHYETHCRSNVHRAAHRLADSAAQLYWQARQRAARYLNAPKVEEIIFTSGTTSAVNILSQGLQHRLQPGDEIILSIAEHHSNLLPWQLLKQISKIKLKWVAVTADGRIDLNHFEQLLSPRTRLVAISHASNVTGAITDLKSITKLTRPHNILVFADGAQMAAHGPVDVQALGVDFYAFSGHKCYGPTGVGVLWGKEQCLDLLQPTIVGGGMVTWVTPLNSEFLSGYQRFEAGTPPIGQAIGLGEALHWLMSLPWSEIAQHEQRLSEHMLALLKDIPGLYLLGPAQTDQRLPIFSFHIDNFHPHDLCHLLDQQGLALRGGQHCAQPLHAHFNLNATCRASLSFLTLSSEIKSLGQALNQTMEILG